MSLASALWKDITQTHPQRFPRDDTACWRVSQTPWKGRRSRGHLMARTGQMFKKAT